MPWRSTCVPIMKPGTSARNSSGTLKALQVQMKRAALSAESTNSTPPFWLRLVGDDADDAPLEARVADDQLLGPARVDLEERAGVDERVDQRLACRTACSRRPGSSSRIERVGAGRAGRRGRRLLLPVRGEVRQVAPARGRCPPRRLSTRKWPQPETAGVHPRAAHLLERDLLADHHLGHARRAEVHRGVAVAHDHDVAEGRDVRAAGGATGRTARTPAARRPSSCTSL